MIIEHPAGTSPRAIEALRLARLALTKGALANAANHLRTVLELAPTHTEAMDLFVNLYKVHTDSALIAPIIVAYRTYLRTRPAAHAVRLALGRSLILTGRTDEARIELAQVIAKAPHDLAALNEYASLLARNGRFEEAHAALQGAANRAGIDAESLHTIGRTYLYLHRFNEALQLFDRTLALAPDHAQAMAGRGAVYDAVMDHDRAVPIYSATLELDPTDRWVSLRLAALLAQRGATAESGAVIAAYLQHAPNDSVALVRDALLLPIMNDSNASITAARARYAQRFEALVDRPLSISPQEMPLVPATFDLAYHGRDNLPLLSAMTRTFRRACPALEYRAPHTLRKRKPKRLRIGVISNFLRRHTIGRLYRGILEEFDRKQFELVVIRPFTATADDVSRAIDARADAVVSLPRGLEAAQRTLGGLELDTLLFADIGMDEFCFLLAFGRYARVQAVSWGHPETTAIPTIDYFLSSARLETAAADRYYSERLVRLANLPCCYRRPITPPRLDRSRFDLPADRRLYGCPQSLFKFHPEFDPILGDILRGDPRGLLVIPVTAGAWGERLRTRFAANMPDVLERIRFMPFIPNEHYLGFVQAMDVLLDPIHFGGGNTSYESMAVAAPTVTWPGEFMRGRVTAGAYDQMGFRELIVDSAAAYVERAIRVANDEAYRRDCVSAMQESAGQLFDDVSVVREIEAFFTSAYSTAP